MPLQTPPLQVSLLVPALPSSHGFVLNPWVQPWPGLQLSSVHTLASSQFVGAPPVHVPL